MAKNTRVLGFNMRLPASYCLSRIRVSRIVRSSTFWSDGVAIEFLMLNKYKFGNFIKRFCATDVSEKLRLANFENG